MARFIAKRLLAFPVLLLGITVLTFLVSHLTPIDPVVANLGDVAVTNPQIVAAYRARWGLDRPLIVQYGVYVTHLMRGEFGVSLTSRRFVADDLKEYFPATLELATAAIIVAASIGGVLAILGTLAGSRGVRVIDLLALVQVSIPIFWLGLVVLALVNLYLPAIPTLGQLDPGLVPPPHMTGLVLVDAGLSGNWGVFSNALAHLFIPALVLASYWIGVIAILLRGNLADALSADYVRTARGKGLPPHAIVLRHALRNAVFPVLTILGVLYGQLLGGAVLTESIFSWPGLGFYAFQAATNIDFPGIMGVTLIVAGSFASVNLLVDLSYALLDPRIRFE